MVVRFSSQAISHASSLSCCRFIFLEMTWNSLLHGLQFRRIMHIIEIWYNSPWYVIALLSSLENCCNIIEGEIYFVTEIVWTFFFYNRLKREWSTLNFIPWEIYAINCNRYWKHWETWIYNMERNRILLYSVIICFMCFLCYT